MARPITFIFAAEKYLKISDYFENKQNELNVESKVRIKYARLQF